LFGGYGLVDSNEKTLGDTWTWDGTAWAEIHLAKSPSPRVSASIAVLGDRVVLYGGTTTMDGNGKGSDETWTWDGSTWEEVTTGGPPARWEAAMASAGGLLVLFGGRASFETAGVLGDTWTWDGHAWAERKVSGPSRRSGAAMGTLNGEAMLFGGEGDDTQANFGNQGDTWIWDGTQWTEQKVPGPQARWGAAMAPYMARRSRP
jgi:hypothetical protein